jgi:hypothetical protein
MSILSPLMAVFHTVVGESKREEKEELLFGYVMRQSLKAISVGNRHIV